MPFDDESPPVAPLRPLDLGALALGATSVSGVADMRGFSRLLSDAPPVEWGEGAGHVAWCVQAHWRTLRGTNAPVRTDAGDRLWLNVKVRASVPQTCQRCLAAVWEDVELDRWFRFEADEAVAEREDESAEEDVLVWRERLDLAELIEDELILAMPLVPLHGVCPAPLPQPAPEDVSPADAGHPFAALRSLKRDTT